nr:unnamed protein product [Digitaria exilis]
MASASGIKRARKDGHQAMPRPMASSQRREERLPATPSQGTPWIPTRTEAFRFVKAVQREFEFAGKTSMYKDFLEVLCEYNRGRLGVAGVVDLMEVILQGHPHIIRWFNKFVPSGYEVKDLQAPPMS